MSSCYDVFIVGVTWSEFYICCITFMIEVVRWPDEITAALTADLFNVKQEVSLKTNSTVHVQKSLS